MSRCPSWQVIYPEMDHFHKRSRLVSGEIPARADAVTIIALLITLVLLFSFKGEVIVSNP